MRLLMGSRPPQTKETGARLVRMMVARLRNMYPRLWGCLVILICGITFSVAAQDCTLSAFVEPSNAVVGQSILYILKLECAEKPDGPPDLPLIDSDLGFSDFRSAGTSSQLQIVNGRVSQTFEYRYSFSVSRKGRFKIPPARIVVGERELKSNEVEIVIGDTPSAPACKSPGGTPGTDCPTSSSGQSTPPECPVWQDLRAGCARNNEPRGWSTVSAELLSRYRARGPPGGLDSTSVDFGAEA
ncbi:MAG: hypothetical protein KatS3mg130_0448 [Candidatus Sumerlaea sp.]|nr:MAG: hypothetical protein KatS3mg130_0448 [Candidatus Sumerlaea sp.]